MMKLIQTISTTNNLRDFTITSKEIEYAKMKPEFKINYHNLLEIQLNTKTKVIEIIKRNL